MMKLAGVEGRKINIAYGSIFIFNCVNYGYNIRISADKRKRDSQERKAALLLKFAWQFLGSMALGHGLSISRMITNFAELIDGYIC